MLQNALDAIDLRASENPNFKVFIHVSIDLGAGRISVTDNGIGMDEEQFKFCFRPSVSFKQRRESRGHKGVGATFLAYGYSLVRLQSKRKGRTIAAVLRNGRQWAEDNAGSYKRPVFEAVSFECSDLVGEPSGTNVEVLVGSGQRPQLTWLQASNAKQWLDVLRIKTPLGGIYLSAKNRKYAARIVVDVIDVTGTKTTESSENIDYFYPYEMPILTKVKSISEIETKISSLSGDPDQRMKRLPDDFRRLDAVWDVWSKDQILSHPILNRNLSEDDKVALQKHDVVVYGCFVSTASSWARFQNDILKVRKSAVLLRGGLQLASDFMVQGDLSVIPLTSTIGYQANTHVVFHLTDGNPDMGRKVFQPEIKTLADEVSRRVVDIFKRYLGLMREDTGIAPPAASRDLWRWKTHQEAHREKHALELRSNGLSLSLVSEPQSEQDVVSLFHELLGMGVLRGYGIYATSQSDKYDCVYFRKADADLQYAIPARPLGVSEQSSQVESEPLILEYKHDLDAFIRDLDKEIKFLKDVDLVVCWDIGSDHRETFTMRSYLIGDEGATRRNFGATHALYEKGIAVEVLCLKDLISFLHDAPSEVARQATKYGS